MTSALPAQPVRSNEVYAVFCGTIDQNAVQRFFQGMAGVMANKITGVHILFQSTGGFIGDGVCLYKFFQSLPVDLTLYNVGTIASIAAIAYLGAKKRKTSAHATFMIHRSYNFPQAATAARLQAVTQGLTLDDRRTEAILRQHITLSEEKWAELNYNDLVFSGPEAVKIGLAGEVGEFAPPNGTQIYNI